MPGRQHAVAQAAVARLERPAVAALQQLAHRHARRRRRPAGTARRRPRRAARRRASRRRRPAGSRCRRAAQATSAYIPRRAVGAGLGHALARIEDAGRVEHGLDAAHGVELGLAVLAAERVQLLEPDPVLAGERAAVREHHHEQLLAGIERALERAFLERVVVQPRVQVAVAEVRDRREHEVVARGDLGGGAQRARRACRAAWRNRACRSPRACGRARRRPSAGRSRRSRSPRRCAPRARCRRPPRRSARRSPMARSMPSSSASTSISRAASTFVGQHARRQVVERARACLRR